MRYLTKAALVVATAFVLGSVGMAFGTTPGGSRSSCMDWAARSAPVTTTSTAWHAVPKVRLTEILALNYAVQVSGTLAGDPVVLRVRDASIGGTFTMTPGVTRSPGSSARAFSFTWVGSSPAEHQHIFGLQWRLVSAGGSATMRRTVMTADYLGAPTATTC
jgi:hypothetical protein